MTQYRADFETIPWEIHAVGIRGKVHFCNGKRLRLAEFTQDVEPHWCERGHMGYVLDGRMEITVGGETLVFGPGDGVFLPAGEEHKHMARILTDKVTVFFVEDA